MSPQRAGTDARSGGTSRRGTKKSPKPRVDGKCRAATLALMALSDGEAELARAVSRWETGWKYGVGGKKRVPGQCGPRPILGVLVSCGCRLRKWNPETEELYWFPVNWRVAPSQLKKRCSICHQWRKPVK